MSTFKIQPPDLEECKSFDVYLTKLKVWEKTTLAPEETRGAIIASSLPNNSKKWKKDLQDKFYEQVDGDKLVTKAGVGLVLTFLKKELGDDGTSVEWVGKLSESRKDYRWVFGQFWKMLYILDFDL